METESPFVAFFWAAVEWPDNASINGCELRLDRPAFGEIERKGNGCRAGQRMLPDGTER